MAAEQSPGRGGCYGQGNVLCSVRESREARKGGETRDGAGLAGVSRA